MLSISSSALTPLPVMQWQQCSAAAGGAFS